MVFLNEKDGLLITELLLNVRRAYDVREHQGQKANPMRPEELLNANPIFWPNGQAHGAILQATFWKKKAIRALTPQQPDLRAAQGRISVAA